MSAAMVLYNTTNLNSILSPNSMLLTPIELILESIRFMDETCSAIRSNRNLGHSTTALDNLQNTLEAARLQLFENINSLHEKYGSNLSDYNDPSIDTLNDCSEKLASELLPRLQRVAYGGTNGNVLGPRFGSGSGSSSMENPHFGEITRRFEEIDEVIRNVVETIRNRMEVSLPSSTRPSNSSYQPRLRRNLLTSSETTNETSVNTKALAGLIEHAKNSWFEKPLGGNMVYVNAYDEDIIRTERPENAYIKRDLKEREYQERLKAHTEWWKSTPGGYTWSIVPDDRGNQWRKRPINWSGRDD